MQSKLKKLFAVLILAGAVLAFCSPAMARFSEVGDTIDFAGYNWILIKKDANSGYLIAKGAINDTPFKADGSSNKYSESDLRKKVNECEEKLKNYTGPQLTWDCVNGTADGKNYIEKHDMTEKDRNPGFSSMNEYDDLLYVLSFYEAAEAFEARKVRSHFQEDGNDVLGWLRSTNPKSTKTGCYVLADQTGTRGSARDSFDLEYVIKYRVETSGIACPALQISLDSPIFTKTDGQSDGVEETISRLLPAISELPEQLKIKNKITQTSLVPVLSPERITGVSGLTKAVSKTRLTMTVEQSGGAEDKQTAKFKIQLGKKIENYDKTKPLAVLIKNKAEYATDGDDSAILMSDEDDFDTVITTAGEPDSEPFVIEPKDKRTLDIQELKGEPQDDSVADGGTPGLTQYTAFKAEYDERLQRLRFVVPNYGKYFQSGETEIIVAELNEDVKFDGEEQEKSSSGGCNAGFGALALLALAGLALRGTKNNERRTKN